MDPVRTIIAGLMLLGAAWWDLRERRVPNLFWFPFVACAAVFLAVDLAEGAWWSLLGSFMVALLSYLFFRFGMWGGADAKGVMILAFLVRENLNGFTTVAALDALVAGVVLVLLWPVSLLAWNLAHRHFAFPAMFVGRVVPIEQARRSRVWPMQDVDGWRYRSRIGQDVSHIYHQLQAAGRTQVWVTPQLPLMAFIAAGFIAVSLFGSPLSWFGLNR